MKKNIELIRQFGKIQIVTTLIIALFFMTTGFLIIPNLASATALTDAKDTISTPIPGSLAQHSWVFTTATILDTGADATADANFFFQFPQTNPDPFTIGAILVADVTVTCTSCDTSVFSVTAVTVSDTGGEAKNDAIKVEVDETAHDSADIPVGSVITVTIDAAPGITNPSKSAAVGTADTYQIQVETREDLGNTTLDEGTSMVAIIEGVTVSVTIDETLAVTLAETSAALCDANIPGTDLSDDAGHDADEITFGTLSAGDAFNHSCHKVIVSTNADDGYTTTVEKTQVLTSGGNTIADGDCTSSSCSAILSGEWAGTSDNGFGYCLKDVTGNPALTTDSSDDSGTGATDWTTISQCSDGTPEFKTFPTTGGTPEPIMKSYAEVSGDEIRIGVVLNYSDTAPAGTYTTVLRFITTPTF